MVWFRVFCLREAKFKIANAASKDKTIKIMIQPNELKLNLPMELSNGVISTTAKVWDTLVASYEGNIEKVKNMVGERPELIYAQYNYTPLIHFAVREGHL